MDKTTHTAEYKPIALRPAGDAFPKTADSASFVIIPGCLHSTFIRLKRVMAMLENKSGI